MEYAIPQQAHLTQGIGNSAALTQRFGAVWEYQT